MANEGRMTVKQKTRQEEIREGVAQIIHFGGLPKGSIGDGDKHDSMYFWGKISKDILKYLDSCGVVMKVDGELPKDEEFTKTRKVFLPQEHPAFDTGYFASQQDMLKAGYTKTERLIDES